MQVTLDIDEDVLDRAERIASEADMSVGGVVSELMRLSLSSVPPLVLKNGLPVRALRPGEKPTVTSEHIRKMLDSEES